MIPVDLPCEILNLAEVAFVSMLPIAEVRGGIPLGFALGIPWWKVFIVASAANIFPVPFILKLFHPIEHWLRQWKTWDRFFTWLFANTRERAKTKIEKWGPLGLILFVAVPLPITGAWTGSLIAYLFNLKFKDALLYIILGVLIAAVIVTLASETGLILLGG